MALISEDCEHCVGSCSVARTEFIVRGFEPNSQEITKCYSIGILDGSQVIFVDWILVTSKLRVKVESLVHVQIHHLETHRNVDVGYQEATEP